MKTLFLILALAIAATAYGSWISMRKIGSDRIDFTYAQCYYEQLWGDFRIAIVVEGGPYSCPYSIQYNPVTGYWK